jgi:hypothetical protein
MRLVLPRTSYVYKDYINTNAKGYLVVLCCQNVLQCRQLIQKSLEGGDTRTRMCSYLYHVAWKHAYEVQLLQELCTKWASTGRESNSLITHACLLEHSEFPLGRSPLKGFVSEGLGFDYRFVI